MMSFGGWGLETSHNYGTSVRVRVWTVKLALKMALYRYFTRERQTYPTKVPSLSDKQVEKTNAEVKRTLEEDTSGRGKYNEYTPCPLENVMSSSTAFYTQLSLHICTSTPRSNVWTGRSVRVMYMSRDNHVWHHCLQKQIAKLKSAKWNWRPICQINFPPNFPAIRYSYPGLVWYCKAEANCIPKNKMV